MVQVPSDKARILCSDYRDLPVGKGAYTKIVSLEMAEVRIVCISFRLC